MKRAGKFGGNSKEPFCRHYSFSVNQSADHPRKCRFDFQSVLANTALVQLEMSPRSQLESSATILSNVAALQRSPTRMVRLSSIDRLFIFFICSFYLSFH
jgi:hypothetical protein